jgi:hypothetical protein
MIANNEIDALQRMMNNLMRAENNFSNLLDWRTSLDKFINFEKTAKEVSSNVDPIIRQWRNEVKNMLNEIA